MKCVTINIDCEGVLPGFGTKRTRSMEKGTFCRVIKEKSKTLDLQWIHKGYWGHITLSKELLSPYTKNCISCNERFRCYTEA